MTALRRLGPVAGLALALVAAAMLWAGRQPQASADPAPSRAAVVAGAFYPGSPSELRRTVEGFLERADPDVPAEWQAARPVALIVPHAGYTYSGQTAAFAYKLLEGKERPSRVILIGPSHRFPLGGTCSVADFSHYETPLGAVPVDGEAREKLAEAECFQALRRPHQAEHCLEVQLPFLQVLWPDPPKIVPILVGQLSPSECRAAAAGIAGILDEDALLLVSTDFTHYGSGYGFQPFRGTPADKLREKINELDMGAVERILALDPAGFARYIAERRPTICGRVGVQMMLELLAQCRGCQPEILKWSNSGDLSGSYEQCVSYVALAVYAPAGALGQIKGASPSPAESSPADTAAEAGTPPVLTDGDKRTLLGLARQAIERQVNEGGKAPAPSMDEEDASDALQARCGVFVTLEKQGRLRGCIGHIVSDLPLHRSVCEVAPLAALRDPRFEPVEPDELDDIEISISVMTRPKRTQSVEEIQVGRDGLIIRMGRRQGLLLPQVATEYGWSRDEFLEHTCRKAGLPPDAWQRADAMVYRFSATVFGEKELGLRHEPAGEGGT